MQLRTFFLLLLISVTTSCQFFETDKKLTDQEIEEIVNFSVVDVSPSFAICDSVIDKEKKTACFRETMCQHISQRLAKTVIEVNTAINETVSVYLFIDKQGDVTLKKIVSSAQIKMAIPQLDLLIEQSLHSLPNLFPAIKRGIPVSTQYVLPIKVNIQ